MKVVAISVGGPRAATWRGRAVTTSIFKTATTARVHIGKHNVEGDEQTDLSVHGGFEKAVYAYPAEHYEFWRRELPDTDLPWGAFGENFTTEGLLEVDVFIGDRFRVGTAELAVTQPRMPCYKLAIRFDRLDIVKRFLESKRSGFYFSVSTEGHASAGDRIERVARDERALSVADVVALYTMDTPMQPLLARASDHPALPAGWREYFRKRMWAPDVQ